MDNCDGIKLGHPVSNEWCLFLQDRFWIFRVECLVISIIKKKSGNNKTSGKYKVNKINTFKISECVQQR